MKWAEDDEITGFKALYGSLNGALKRHGLKRINLHNKAEDLMDEEIARGIVPCREESRELTEEKDITASCMYNTDQTGFFNSKLPNPFYVRNQEKKGYKGSKKMKDKAIITEMLCTAAEGHRFKIGLIGKSKNPVCFELL